MASTHRLFSATSDYASIDIKRGRRSLLKLTERGYRIPVVVTGYITGPGTGDDGTSIEFEIAPTLFTLGKPEHVSEIKAGPLPNIEHVKRLRAEREANDELMEHTGDPRFAGYEADPDPRFAGYEDDDNA